MTEFIYGLLFGVILGFVSSPIIAGSLLAVYKNYKRLRNFRLK